MFKRFQTKLTVLYAGVFGAGLVVVALLVTGAVSTAAEKGVRDALTASAGVFDRVFALREGQMRDGAELLARDYGFREALGTGDRDTVASALDNLRRRLEADAAFMVDVSGDVVAVEAPSGSETPIADALFETEAADGVAVLGGRPFQTVSAPILAPDLKGWIVFARRLDRAEMRDLETLAAIPIRAEVLQTAGDQARAEDGRPVDPALAAVVRASAAAKAGGDRARIVALTGGRAVVAAERLPTVGTTPTVLVLRYPLAEALAPYRPLLWGLAAAGLVGLALLMVASWLVARGVTRPIAALDAAARRLRDGEAATVEVRSSDEIGRLADSFNAMSSEIREREARIVRQALHDSETDLPNRIALERRLNARSSLDGLAVAAVGIDRFASLRGAIGYAPAAEVVAAAGRRLSAAIDGAFVARLSSDVLAVAAPAADEAAMLALAERARAALSEPVQVRDDAADLTVAVGAAGAPLHATTASDLVERASVALDQARAKRVRAQLFDAEAYGDPVADLALMSEMRRAMADGQMTVHHQPKYDLRLGRVTGFESLVRWTHPRRGPLSPDRFVGLAEETGHIGEMTEWVLDRALADQARLAERGLDYSAAINLSGRLVDDEAFARRAIDAVGRARGPVTFEITETALIERVEAAAETVARFKAAGIAVALDDYGAGLSSLGYLQKIKADELKLDRSFVTGMAEGARDALLVKSTIDLAHGLGMRVVAEGVETDVVAVILAGMGCDLAQGWFFGRPGPVENLIPASQPARAPDARTA